MSRVGARAAGAALSCVLSFTAFAQPGPVPPIKPGFPLTLTGGKRTHGAPVIADFGLTPGRKSVVFGTKAGRLYVVTTDGATASAAAGFPVTLPGDVYSSPAVGDLDGDGLPDIVVGYGSTIEFAETGNTAGGVRAYRRNGTLLWQRSFGTGQFSPVMGTPAIGDVDGDGQVEVVWGAANQNIYVVRGSDGTDKPGWPIAVCDTIFSSATLADLDGDGLRDVIIGQDAHLTCPAPRNLDGGCLNAFRGTGASLPGFPVCVDQTISSAPAVADLDGDGSLDVVVGTGLFWAGRNRRVYAFRSNGTALPGWPATVDGQVNGAIAIGDLDRDGTPEVIASDEVYGGSTARNVYVFNANGTLRWKRQPKDYDGSNLNASAPVVADVLGDSNLEVLVATNGEICVFDKDGNQLTRTTGSPATNPSFPALGVISDPAVANFEPGSGDIEVVAISGTPFPTYTDSKVNVWNPKSTNVCPPWGMFKNTADRGSIFPGSPACDRQGQFFAITPCRAIDTRNPNGPLAGPRIAAQRVRSFKIAGGAAACVSSVPRDAVAVAANVTVVFPDTAGELRLFPGNGATPLYSSISFPAGKVRANTARLSLYEGVFTVDDRQATGSVDVLLDVSGYFK